MARRFYALVSEKVLGLYGYLMKNKLHFLLQVKIFCRLDT